MAHCNKNFIELEISRKENDKTDIVLINVLLNRY